MYFEGLRDVDDSTRWVGQGVAPRLGLLPSTVHRESYLPDGPDPLAVDHDATLRLYATNHGVSRCFAGPQPDEFDLAMAIPHGYTDLRLHEKRAVVANGHPLAIWPLLSPAAVSIQFRLIVPPSGEHKWLELGCFNPVRSAVAQAMNLSSRLQQPVLVTRLLESHFWH